ncbi:unnamed protein product [Peniophora sp. CBMAI 1063]|nr:unnamed protein product [Peniophora sp. CBMAI 1063]
MQFTTTLFITMITAGIKAAAQSCSAGSGTLQCCDTVLAVGNAQLASLLSEVNVDPSIIEGLVGVDCKPLTAGAMCDGAPGCCPEGLALNASGSLLTIDCTAPTGA